MNIPSVLRPPFTPAHCRTRGQRPRWTTGLMTLTLLVLCPSTVLGFSGNEWNRLPEVTRHAYVMGILDGWGWVATVDDLVKNIRTIRHIVECASSRKMPYGQILAIADKYMKDNPTELDYPMVRLVWNAMADTCKP